MYKQREKSLSLPLSLSLSLARLQNGHGSTFVTQDPKPPKTRTKSMPHQSPNPKQRKKSPEVPIPPRSHLDRTNSNDHLGQKHKEDGFHTRGFDNLKRVLGGPSTISTMRLELLELFVGFKVRGFSVGLASGLSSKMRYCSVLRPGSSALKTRKCSGFWTSGIGTWQKSQLSKL